MKAVRERPAINYGPLYERVMFCGREHQLVGSRDSCGAWYRCTDKDCDLNVRTLDSLGSIKHDRDETSANILICADDVCHSYYGPDVPGINPQAAVDALAARLQKHVAAMQLVLESQP